MSQIMTIGRFGFLLLIGLAALAGCGTPNDQNPFDPDGRQKHAADWFPAHHASAAAADISSCKACHGQDLLGGISGYGCGGCHLGGPTSAHPLSWATLTADHGPYVRVSGTPSCRNVLCHGANLEGVAQSGPACGTCH